jgi:hypothetical protein
MFQDQFVISAVMCLSLMSFPPFALHTLKEPRENAQSIQNHVKLKAKNATLTA